MLALASMATGQVSLQLYAAADAAFAADVPPAFTVFHTRGSVKGVWLSAFESVF